MASSAPTMHTYAIDATRVAATQAIADLMRSDPVLAPALDGDNDACLAALGELDDEAHAAILFTLLGIAVEAGNFRLVREVVVRHRRQLLPWTLTSGKGAAVLHIMDYCAYWGDCVAAMLEAGMPPNYIWMFRGVTPLDLVTLLCDIGDVDTLKGVLDAGGSPFCHPAPLAESGQPGSTASAGLSVACAHGNTELIGVLVKRYPGITLPADTEPESHWKALSDCCVAMARASDSQHTRFVTDELPYFMVCLMQKNRELERELAAVCDKN